MAHTWSPHLPAWHAPAPPHWIDLATRAVSSSLRHAFERDPDGPHTPPKPHPARYEYLENSCMARAMERL